METTSRLYERLQLKPNARPSEIRKAFLQVARKVHPDKQRDNENANEEFCNVKEAYDRLVEKTPSPGIIVEQVPLTEWKKVDLGHSNIVYQTNCRCGGQLVLNQDEIISSLDGLVPCDNCSLYVQIVSQF
ncbi:DnaJ homolog subfamily C member 24 [Galdieria sulphuraria]|nr:DnaJ homolog subfamily C member 24 [Galdieria sulphuraria]